MRRSYGNEGKEKLLQLSKPIRECCWTVLVVYQRTSDVTRSGSIVVTALNPMYAYLHRAGAVGWGGVQWGAVGWGGVQWGAGAHVHGDYAGRT